MTPWWEFVVKRLPSWMAPNLITTVGFVAMVVVYVFSLCNVSLGLVCGTGELLAIVLVIFFYQTMDAVDGKQA
jgi:ethanolaminephosphotransferase